MRSWSMLAIVVPLVMPTLRAIESESTADVEARVAEAQEWLLIEVDLIAELDVFRPVPGIDEIRDRVPTDAADREDLILGLDRVDDENVDRLDALFEAGLILSDEVVTTMDPLTDEVIDRLDDGETGFLDPAPWLDALTDLVLRDGDSPIERDENERSVVLDLLDRIPPGEGDTEGDPVSDDTATAESPAPAPAEAPVVVPSTAAASPDVREGPGGSLLPVLAGAAGLLVLVVIVLAVRSRRSPTASPAPAAATGAIRPVAGRLDDLLDTSRRMTAALDALEVQRIAVRDGLRLTRAEAGAFLSAGDAPRFTERLPTDFFADEPVTEGLLARVLETGQSTCATTDDEPSLAQLPMALAAVPVIANGGVAGALVVLRTPSEPFGSDDVDTLAQLAPIVGSALSAAEEHQSAVTDAERDGLTALLNRRRLDRDLSSVTGAPMAFAMIDVDHFKHFNDVHGHQGGDDALRAVADVLSSTVRATDVVYRYGGEEFSVLLRDTTTEEAHEVLERVREAIEGTEIVASDGRSLGEVTISVGVVATASEVEESTTLPERADRALYEAKAGGRNRVVIGA